MSLELDFTKYNKVLKQQKITNDIGKVTQVTGHMMEGYVPGACLGSICEVYPMSQGTPFLAEVVGFRDRHVVLMPLSDMWGVGLGAKILLKRTRATVTLGEDFLGRVVNGLGEPIDDKGDLRCYDESSLYSEGTNPLARPPIRQPLSLGVRAIDGLLTVGQGQRVGIMAGSGVGKSVLMGMIARSTSADVNVIAMIGERGREVREFIEDILGPEGLARSVVVAVTSDQSPLIRMRGAFLATAIAEYFCQHRKADVLLMMDSVTRFATAQREIGLSTGEPPASKGYTPSVFSLLPKLLERAGNFEGAGSITGLYTVLVEGDDMDDPIADSVRSIVDGHIILDRKLAQRGHFPAIDTLQSTSRVMKNIVDQDQISQAMAMRKILSVYREAEDLINIGAYKSGSNPEIDQAIEKVPGILNFLQQGIDETSNLQLAQKGMREVLGG